jgi:hypothetical protein
LIHRAWGGARAPSEWLRALLEARVSSCTIGITLDQTAAWSERDGVGKHLMGCVVTRPLSLCLYLHLQLAHMHSLSCRAVAAPSGFTRCSSPPCHPELHAGSSQRVRLTSDQHLPDKSNTLRALLRHLYSRQWRAPRCVGYPLNCTRPLQWYHIQLLLRCSRGASARFAVHASSSRPHPTSSRLKHRPLISVHSA